MREWGPLEWSAIAQATSTVLIVVFTGLLAYYNRSLMGATKTSAEAAKKSADAAERALLLIQDALILLDGAFCTPKGDITAATLFSVVLKNYGTVAARQTVVRARLLLGNDIIDAKKSLSPSTVGPNQPTRMEVGPIPGEHVSGVNEGRLCLIVIADVEYATAREKIERRFVATYDKRSKSFKKTELDAWPKRLKQQPVGSEAAKRQSGPDTQNNT